MSAWGNMEEEKETYKDTIKVFFSKIFRKKKSNRMEDDIDWGEEAPAKKEVLPDNLWEKPSRVKVKVPRGRAVISVDKRSWLVIIVGTIIVLVNLVLLFASTLGYMQRWEEKVLVCLYCIPTIYITANYTWIKIKGEKVSLDDD